MVPAQLGWIKINTDGATDDRCRRGGAGFVARDHFGSFIAAAGARSDHVVDPLSVELLVCRDALCFARDKCFQKVHVETDYNEIQLLWESGSERSMRFIFYARFKN